MIKISMHFSPSEPRPQMFYLRIRISMIRKWLLTLLQELKGLCGVQYEEVTLIQLQRERINVKAKLTGDPSKCDSTVVD